MSTQDDLSTYSQQQRQALLAVEQWYRGYWLTAGDEETEGGAAMFDGLEAKLKSGQGRLDEQELLFLQQALDHARVTSAALIQQVGPVLEDTVRQVVRPHLEIDMKHLARQTACFTTQLAAVLSGSDASLLSLRLSLLRLACTDLAAIVESIDSFLAILEKERTK